ncbi:hypothetical protein KEJ24_02225 [Candidatus Bathyarchaeota archaeon]|nr:hypothetical protein [Candidatus Bathyarchaeota archaeon]
MESPKSNLAIAFALALAAMVTTALVAGLLPAIQTIQSSGNVRATLGLGVYSDSSCTVSLSSIDWGEVILGQNYTRTIYLKNLGNVKVTLSMIYGNWTPSSASNYLTLTWNRENAILNVGESISANLILTVKSNAQGGSFSFDISIIATETQ